MFLASLEINMQEMKMAKGGALLLGAVLLLAIGGNPVSYYTRMFTMGTIGNKIAYKAFENYLKDLVPLALTAVALSLAFKMKFWNLGGNGQIFVGCLAAIACMFYLGGKIPEPVLILLMTVSSIAAGAVWGVLPAVFKAYFDTNESLFTLMLNYIAAGLVPMFIAIWVKSGSGKLDPIAAGSFPKLFGNEYLLTILVFFVLAGLMYIYLNYTKHGYEISVVGESHNTARYVGIKTERVIIRTMLLSGALCGVAGLLLVGGTDHTVTTTIAGGRGFTAILVSWLGKFNPIYMILTAFLVVFLQRGTSFTGEIYRLDTSMADIFIGAVLLFIIGCEFFINYKINFRKRDKEGK